MAELKQQSPWGGNRVLGWDAQQDMQRSYLSKHR